MISRPVVGLDLKGTDLSPGLEGCSLGLGLVYVALAFCDRPRLSRQGTFVSSDSNLLYNILLIIQLSIGR